MRLYELRDETNESAGVLAYLECYEQARVFFLELCPDVDAWDLPPILHEHAKRGSSTVGATWSRRWVQSRIVPPERQNLGEVLRTNGLEEYDELRLLELTDGRCSQDACYLTRVATKDLPAWYDERLGTRLSDIYALSGFRLLACFRSGSCVICAISDLVGDERTFRRVSKDEEAFRRVALQAGGHGVRWGDTLEIPCDAFAASGDPVPLNLDDIALLSRQCVCDTSEVADLLGCTRQNVSDLVRRKRIIPLKSNRHAKLFFRPDVLDRT